MEEGAAVTDLTEFLLARIAEDEAVAERGRRHNGRGTFENDNYGCLLVDPARILAECEAKRRIVEDAIAADDHDPSDAYADGYRCALERVCEILALPYADHPDHRQEWRP